MKNHFYVMTFIVLGSIFSYRTECQNLSDGVVAYWNFNETSGTTLADQTNNRNGTVQGAVTINQTGKLGRCILIDANSEYISFASLTQTTGSYSFWCYVTNSDDDRQVLSSNAYYNRIFMTSSNRYPRLETSTNGQEFQCNYSTTINAWHHIVFTRNSSNLFVCYIDGVQSCSQTISGAADLTINQIGSNGRSFYGYLDEIGIWNRALSSSEVTSLYNSAPNVTTNTTTNIAQTTVTSGGNVTSDGGVSVTARGVCWSTSANPTTSNSKTTNGTGTGTFASSITGLTAGTTYHVRAYATNSVGTSYGSDLTFTTTTNPVVPAVTTNAATYITQITATSGGNVTADGGASVTARGVCWSNSANPTTSNSKTTDGTGTGTFVSSITGLTEGTTYHIRAYATNSVGTAYGSDLTFSTTTSGSGSWQTSGSNIYYNSGKVSIGTTIANSASALTVGGKILATEVEVVSSITADDVFEPQYKLLPLPELETYLIQNKHLPGIPSAAEIAEKGQNLGEMDDLLLRKIEELTLYILEQNKTIEWLKGEIKQLKCSMEEESKK